MQTVEPGSHTQKRIASLKDHLRAALTMGTTRAPNDRSRTRCTNQAPPGQLLGGTLCENTSQYYFVTTKLAQSTSQSALRGGDLWNYKACTKYFPGYYFEYCSELAQSTSQSHKLRTTKLATLCEKQRVSFDFEHPKISLDDASLQYIPMQTASLGDHTQWHSALNLWKITSAQRWQWGPPEHRTK